MVCAEKVVIGAVGNKLLFTHIAERGATGIGSRSSFGVQTLDEGGLGQEFAARSTGLRPDRLQ